MKIYILFLSLIFVLSCSKKNDPTTNLIDPKDASKLMEVIITPPGGEKKQGDLPEPSQNKESLKIINENPAITNVAQNETIILRSLMACQSNTNNNCDDARKAFKRIGNPYCVFRIKGSTFYFVYPYAQILIPNGKVSFNYKLPENIGNGEFETDFSYVDEYGFATNITTNKVIVNRLDDKDNPAKAYGCNFSKAASELVDLINKFNNVASCELVKSKYNDLVNAILNCKDIPEASKTELRKANQDMQAIDCSIFGNNAKKKVNDLVQNILNK